MTVRSDLSLADHANAFVVGDVADIDDGHGGRLPQLAQVAIQSGRHASEQILHTIEREPRTAFRYLDKGTMATIGRRAAVAELPGRIKLTGAVAWLAWLGAPPRLPSRCAEPSVGLRQLGVELPDMGPGPSPHPAARSPAPDTAPSC